MCVSASVPALRMLPTEIRDDVEQFGIRAFWVILQDAHVDVLQPRRNMFTDSY